MSFLSRTPVSSGRRDFGWVHLSDLSSVIVCGSQRNTVCDSIHVGCSRSGTRKSATSPPMLLSRSRTPNPAQEVSDPQPHSRGRQSDTGGTSYESPSPEVGGRKGAGSGVGKDFLYNTREPGGGNGVGEGGCLGPRGSDVRSSGRHSSEGHCVPKQSLE